MLDNQAALVAYTRLTDGKYTMYADSATMESLGDRPGMDRLKENATKSDRKTLTKAQSIRVQTVTPVVQEKPKVQEVQREQPEVEQKVRVQSQRR
jgi:ribosomal protein S30